MPVVFANVIRSSIGDLRMKLWVVSEVESVTRPKFKEHLALYYRVMPVSSLILPYAVEDLFVHRLSSFCI